jgi:hypothetical protein
MKRAYEVRIGDEIYFFRSAGFIVDEIEHDYKSNTATFISQGISFAISLSALVPVGNVSMPCIAESLEDILTALAAIRDDLA